MDFKCPKCGGGWCWPLRGSYKGKLWCERCDHQEKEKAILEGAICKHGYATTQCDECRPKDWKWNVEKQEWEKGVK